MKGQNQLVNGAIFVFCFGALAIAAPRPNVLSNQVSSEPADRR